MLDLKMAQEKLFKNCSNFGIPMKTTSPVPPNKHSDLYQQSTCAIKTDKQEKT